MFEKMWSFLLFLLMMLLMDFGLPQNLVPYAKEFGGTFCYYLTMKSQLPRSFFRDCGPPTCSWDVNHDGEAEKKKSVAVTNKKERIVLSYAHNGFGNQLWQHTIAFMIAESLQARFFIQAVPDILCPDGVSPPNTWQGMGAMERLLPSEYLYTNLPRDSSIRQLCDQESFFLADRPRDWRNGTYTSHFRSNIHSLITDKNPRCIKLLGYFQNYPLCPQDTRQLWTPRLIANFTKKPGPNDISIYLRCVPRHYFFNDRHFYESILNNTKFEKVWLFQAPECPSKLGNDPSRDGQVASVMRLLIERFNASRWPIYKGEDDSLHLLHDLAGLIQSKKLILPVSSWAYWAGLLSNATEIHVNGPPLHPMMTGLKQYIYHDQKKRLYFGRYDNKTNDIEFPPEVKTTPIASTVSAVPATSTAVATTVKSTNTATTTTATTSTATSATTTTAATTATATTVVPVVKPITVPVSAPSSSQSSQISTHPINTLTSSIAGSVTNMTSSNSKSDSSAVVSGGNNGFLANTIQTGNRITADVTATLTDNVRTLFNKYNHPPSETLRDTFSASSSGQGYNNHSNTMLHTKGTALKGLPSLTSSVKMAGGMERPHRRNSSNPHHPRRNASNIHHPHGHSLGGHSLGGHSLGGHAGSKKKRGDARDVAHLKLADGIDSR